MPIKKKKNLNALIGSIVAVRNHPYFLETDKDSTFISGEALSLSPIMVVIETLNEKKHELGSTDKGAETSIQCKCLWYSNKSGLFESTWLSLELLKIIDSKSTSIQSKELQFGSSVIFKTSNIELGKKKLSLKYSSDLPSDKNKTITALLSFVSPVMQVIGLVESKTIEPLIDKNGKIKRAISNQLVKCKFYNAASDKLSEVLIPIEAINKITEITHDLLENISTGILRNQFLKTSNPDSLFKSTFIKPLRIIYKTGRYYLEGEDYLENKTVETLINGAKNQFVFLENQFEQLPRFQSSGKRLTIIGTRKENLSKLSKKYYWRISYKNFSDKITIRTIYNPSFFQGNETDSEGKVHNIDYLKANCILRNHSERYFRIDRIQKLQVLELEATKNIKN